MNYSDDCFKTVSTVIANQAGRLLEAPRAKQKIIEVEAVKAALDFVGVSCGQAAADFCRDYCINGSVSLREAEIRYGYSQSQLKRYKAELFRDVARRLGYLDP